MSLIQKLFKGIHQFGPDAVQNRITGAPAHLAVNVASADSVIEEDWQNCKGISCDVAGLIKIDKTNPQDGTVYTEVLQVEPGTIYPIPFVTKVYRYYVGTTPCTAQVYTDAGAAVVGIKLRR